MGKLIAFNMISIDGFFEGKNRELDWHTLDDKFHQFSIRQLDSASSLIFGRLTYELMMNYWTKQFAMDNDPIVASQMNSIDKIVFSRTLKNVSWQNATLYSHVEPIVSDLKKNSLKNILIFGSANLVETINKVGLIDEYRFMVSPIALGQGRTLFSGMTDRLKLVLTKIETFDLGNILLCYEPQ